MHDFFHSLDLIDDEPLLFDAMQQYKKGLFLKSVRKTLSPLQSVLNQNKLKNELTRQVDNCKD